jgi:hypothetical protein
MGPAAAGRRVYTNSPRTLVNIPGRNKSGAPGRTRTCDHRLRRPVLYPAELRARDGRILTARGPAPQRGGPKMPAEELVGAARFALSLDQRAQIVRIQLR